MYRRPLYTALLKGWKRTVFNICEAAGLGKRLAGEKRVLIKPNLVEAIAPPVTTPVELVRAVVEYIEEKAPHVEIIIGEGTGAADYETERCFETLGYSRLAREKGIWLIDLNRVPLVKLSDRRFSRWPELYLPQVVLDSFLISVPVLKAHSLSEVTLAMKNMVGVAPPAHYRQGGHWKKSAFHNRMQESILDLNRYRAPDFSILDATVGMKEAHLWGATCDPKPGLLVAGFDPVAVDAFGADILKRNPDRIGHIKGADGVLGLTEPSEVVRVGV